MPWKNASTHGRAPAAASAGWATTRTRSVASHRRATIPRSTPSAARAPSSTLELGQHRLARSSDGSFSIARSSICTALALSPCFALISPR